MNRLIYLFAVLLLAMTFSCKGKSEKDIDPDVYTAAYISSLSIEEPQRALALIDTAEQEKLMNDFDVNRLRAIVYHNGLSDNIKSLEYALKAYGSPSARDNLTGFLRLIGMIADQYYLNGDYAQSIRFCTEGLTLAHDSLMAESEAALSFDLGRNLLMLNREDEGLRYYRKAVEILDKESRNDRNWETADDYVYTLAILIGTLRNEEHYDEAIELLPKYEEAVGRLEKKDGLPAGLIDMRNASGYGMGAVLYAIRGDKDSAEEQYQKLLATEYAKTPDAGQLIIPYLYQAGNYKEALRRLLEEKKFWQANTDTVSYSYIENHLESELAVYEKLGDIRAANSVLHTIRELTDTLRERDRNEKALELAEIYKTQQQALRIEKQSVSIILRNIVIIAAVIVLIVCGLYIVRILRFNRTISEKNKAMVGTIDDLISYKDRLLELQEENLQLKTSLTANTQPAPKEIIPEAESAPEDAVDLTEGDRAFFERINFEILSQRLYLDPGFSRSTVLTRFRIPAYKFSSIFKEYAGCSFSQYVHNCRLDYAVKLMRENPSWSLEAIAKAAQMSSSSFYSQFKKKYGMNPSDFKGAEAPD